MNTFEVIVVGGGASGLIAAIEIAKRGISVCIVERFAKLGKKILATGNGRCNMTNLQLHKEDYRSEKPDFPYQVLQQFSARDTLSYFEKLGVLWKDENGYIYPRSEQATTVVSALELKIQSLNIPIYYEKEVIKIAKKDGEFQLLCQDGTTMTGRHCVIATGGKAQPKLGSNGSGYELAKQLGHTIIPVVPALTGLHTNHWAISHWAGVRAKASIACVVDKKMVWKEQGELQLTNYGVSGVPTFQISRYATDGFERGKQVVVAIDFAWEYSKEELETLLERLLTSCSYKNIREVLEGVFSKKLVPIFLKEAKIVETTRANQIQSNQLHTLVMVIKNFELLITGSNSFDQAQVCAGGVSVEEIQAMSLQSKKVEGLYFAGEVLDVDGTCGGYNLQWAWASGYVVGNAILGNMQTKKKEVKQVVSSKNQKEKIKNGRKHGDRSRVKQEKPKKENNKNRKRRKK